MTLPDDSRDAHLRAALRHAPDLDARPAAAVREAILAASRRAAPATSPRTPEPSPWRRLLAARRTPQATAAFASLAVATVAGVLWRDAPVPPQRASLPPLLDVPAPAPASAPAPVEHAARRPLPRGEASPTPPPPPASAMPRSQPPRRSSAAAAPAPGAAPQPPGHAERAETAADGPKADRSPLAALPPPSPSPSPLPSPSPSPSPSLRSSPAESATSSAPPAPSPARLSDPADTVDRAQGRRLQRSAPTRLAAVRDAVADAPSAWSWQPASAPARPADDTVLAWLALLDATAPAWTPRATPPIATDDVRLQREGGPLHRFQLADTEVVWHGPDGTVSAPLDSPAAARLRAALP